MTIIRQGVELAFEQFEKFQQPTDYGPISAMHDHRESAGAVV
jgi:hypothetical protein